MMYQDKQQQMEGQTLDRFPEIQQSHDKQQTNMFTTYIYNQLNTTAILNQNQPQFQHNYLPNQIQYVDISQKRTHSIYQNIQIPNIKAQIQQIQSLQSQTYQNRKKNYQIFFKTQKQTVNNFNIQQSIKYNISKHPQFKQQIQVINISHSQNYQIIQYQIFLSFFKVNVKLKNQSKNAPIRTKQSFLGAGSYGKVSKVKIMNEYFAQKRIYFQQYQGLANKYKIAQQCLKQYSLYKIASFLKIGPQIKFIYDFDVIWYNDCIEFYMQLCQNPFQMIYESKVLNKKLNLQDDLKLNLKLLHFYKIMHRDIKPQNVLYSKCYQKFVLSDFGTSHPIKQATNIKTKTNICGTIMYFNSQMKKKHTQGNKSGYFDLYQADVYALKKTIQILKFYKNNKIKCQSMKSADVEIELMNQNQQSDKLQRLEFKIRVEGFNMSIYEQMQQLIDEVQGQRRDNLICKLKKHKQEFDNKQGMNISWTKKCDKIEQYFIKKGFLKQAWKNLLNRQQLLCKKQQFNLPQLIQIYQKLIFLSSQFNFQTSKKYIQKLKIIIQNKKSIKSLQNNPNLTFIYDNLNLIIKLYHSNSSNLSLQIQTFFQTYLSRPQIYKQIYRYAVLINKLNKTQLISKLDIIFKKQLKLSNIQFDKSLNQTDNIIKAEFYYFFCRFYIIQQNQIQSIVCALKSIEILKSIYINQDYKYYPIYCLNMNCIGYNYLLEYQLQKSKTYLFQALQLVKINYGQNSIFTAQILNNIAVVYHYQGSYKQAIKYRLQSLKIRQQAIGQNNQKIEISLNGLCLTYFEMGDLIKGIEYQQKRQNLLYIYNRQGVKMLDCFCELLYQYIILQNELKIVQYKKKLDNLVDILQQRQRANFYYSYGKLYEKQKKWQQAKQRYKKSYELSKMQSEKLKILLNLLQIQIKLQIQKNKEAEAKKDIQQQLEKTFKKYNYSTCVQRGRYKQEKVIIQILKQIYYLLYKIIQLTINIIYRHLIYTFFFIQSHLNYHNQIHNIQIKQNKLYHIINQSRHIHLISCQFKKIYYTNKIVYDIYIQFIFILLQLISLIQTKTNYNI